MNAITFPMQISKISTPLLSHYYTLPTVESLFVLIFQNNPSDLTDSQYIHSFISLWFYLFPNTVALGACRDLSPLSDFIYDMEFV